MYCIVTGSCRPFQRSAQLQYEFRDDDRDDDDTYVDDDDDDIIGKYKQPESTVVLLRLLLCPLNFRRSF